MKTTLAPRNYTAGLLGLLLTSACSSADSNNDSAPPSTSATTVGGQGGNNSGSLGSNTVGGFLSGGGINSGTVFPASGTSTSSVGGSTIVEATSATSQGSGAGTGGLKSVYGGSNSGGKSGGIGGSTIAGGTKSTGGRSNGGTKASGGTATSTGGKSSGGNTQGGTSSTETTEDDCTNTLALGVTISEIAIFQSGKISIMKAGTEVPATSQSGAEVIEGRDTLFRVYVTTDSGFQSRQLAARLSLNDGSTQYFAKQTINGSSTELSSANSFLISVPASAIKAGLNYSVQLVECTNGAGTAHSPVFPSNGNASIATRATGVIKLTLVPTIANNITPSLENLSVSLKQAIEAVYPTTSAEITVASTPITGCGISPSTAGDGTTWSKCLTLVRDRRTSDRPASDVYYMGIVTPASSYASYCGNACIGGIGYVSTSSTGGSARAAISVGYDPQGLSSIIHELGHNHGLEHSAGCGASEVDSAFPYIKNDIAYIGWVGWDHRNPSTFFDPAKYKDMMGYCNPFWVSDYVYAKFADRIAALNGSTMLLGKDAVSTWRVLDVIGTKATWGQSILNPTPHEGEPEGATVYDVNGQILLEITVYRTVIRGVKGFMYLVPEPGHDWFQLRIGSTVVEF